MARVILLIGKLCSGKTTYARRVAQEENAILISCDELMRTVFPDPLGDQYDVYSLRCHDYLYRLTARLARSGATPILDFGFWTRASRRDAMNALKDFTLDWRYIDLPDEEWKRRIASRNAAIAQGRAHPDEYPVDDGLLAKLLSRFEPPEPQEGLNPTILRET